MTQRDKFSALDDALYYEAEITDRYRASYNHMMAYAAGIADFLLDHGAVPNDLLEHFRGLRDVARADEEAVTVARAQVKSLGAALAPAGVAAPNQTEAPPLRKNRPRKPRADAPAEPDLTKER